jgi:hypothetical protein
MGTNYFIYAGRIADVIPIDIPCNTLQMKITSITLVCSSDVATIELYAMYRKHYLNQKVDTFLKKMKT